MEHTVLDGLGLAAKAVPVMAAQVKLPLLDMDPTITPKLLHTVSGTPKGAFYAFLIVDGPVNLLPVTIVPDVAGTII